MNPPRLTLVLIVAAACINLASLPAAASLPVNPALLTLAIAVIAFEVRSGRLQLHWPPVLALALTAVVLMVPAALAGLDLLSSWYVLEGLIKDLLFLVVVYFLTAAAGSTRLLAAVVALTLGGLGALAVLNQFVLGNSSSFGGLDVLSTSGGVGVSFLRHQGPFEDPNFFGRLLVLAVPLALSLASRAWHRRLVHELAMWLLVGLSIVGGIYLTGSRGAMLATVAAVVVWMLLAGRQYRRRLIFLPLIMLPLLLVPGVGSRLFTVDLTTGSSFAVEDGSVLERSAAARVTFAIFEANPLLGVGPGNANTLMEPYVAAGEGLVYRNVAAHNTYLQLAAEDGLLGLFGWLAFFSGVLIVGVRTVRAYPVKPHAPPDDARLFAAAGTAAMAAWMTASVFLHFAFLRPLFVVVAMVAVLSYMAPRHVVRPARAVRIRWSWRIPVTVASVLLLVAGLGIAVQAVARPRAWMAEVPVSLKPGGEEPDAYRLSLISRRHVVATYAAVVRDVGSRYVDGRGSLTVVASGQTLSGSLESSFTVRVVSRSRAEAERLAREAAARGSAFVRQSAPLRAFALITPGRVSVVPTRTWANPLGGGQ